MSKKSNDQNIVSESKVLTTSMGRTVVKYAAIFAAIGLLIGILVMVFLNLGLHEMFAAAVSPQAMEEIVAHNASDKGTETPAVTDIQAVLDEYGVDFAPRSVTYTGEEVELLATNTEMLASRGITVTYANNKHTNVGTYSALAIFSAEGCTPVTIPAELKILRADLKAKEDYYKQFFHDVLVEYNPDEPFVMEIPESELPEGVKVSHALSTTSGVGVYHATAVLYGDNYDSLVLEATIKVVDLKELVYFPGVEVIDEQTGAEAIVFTYNKRDFEISLNTSAVLNEIKEERNFKVTYTVTDANGESRTADDKITVTNAGAYTVVATVTADGFTQFTVTVNVKVNQGNIVNVHGIYYGASDLEYNEVHKTVSVNNLPENVTHKVTYYRVIGEGETAVYELIENYEDVCNPGNYRAVIELVDSTGNCKNNVDDNVINYDFTITKRDVSWLYTIEDGKTKYSTETIKYEDGTSEKVGKANRLVMTFDATKLHASILAQPIVVTYTYGDKTVVVTFTFTQETIKDESGNEVIEDKVVSSYEIDGVVYSQKHDFDNVEFEIPVDFVDQGTYTLTAVVSGNVFDDDVTLTPTMFIDFATLTGINVSSSQMVFANNTWQVPKYTGAGKDVTVEIYDKDGNLVQGFKYFGVHDVKLVFTKGNYQTTKTVKFTVMFNPVIAAIGMVVGMLLGLLAGVFIAFYLTSREKASHAHFKAPGTIVANARGGILCESFAKFEGSGCSGRLYLSPKTIEFYAEDYKALKDNFLIDLDDVRNVDAIAHNKLCVYANKQQYIFTVPDGTSAEWAASIVRA